VLRLQPPTFEGRLELVEHRIHNALERSGRERSEITLVAVSKKFSAARLREAYAAGLRDFGENYVQEFSDKKQDLGDLPGARFHLIGHLQSNKARLACNLFDVIQTADSPKLIEKLDASAPEGKHIDVLLEIKLSVEASKTGAAPGQIPALLAAAKGCSRLTVSGLMIIPPWSEDPEASRPYFRKLASLAHEHHLPSISMGMSGDLEVAIEEGATLIRIGTALFGPRPKPASSDPPPSP